MGYEINLIEGERGKLHVTSDDARTENALMFGTGRKVFNMDNSFEASMTDSNTVRITSGVFYDNGMFIRIDRDRYVEVSIENGLPGTFRHDLVCIRYERNIQTQLESASIIVKKGEASETAAVDPEYTVGDVLDLEVHLDEFPLYRVSLNGITPTLEPMFIVEDMISNMVVYNELVAHLQDLDNPHQIASVEHAESADKLKTPVKINGVDFDGTEDVTLPKVEADSALSETSTNALQNKVITKALNGKMPLVNVEAVTDFNTLTETGIYLILIAGCDNAPSGSAGTLFVSGEGEVMQYFFPHSDNTMYVRLYYHNTEWQSWQQLNANSAVQDGAGNVITETYAQKKVISSGDFNDMVTPGFYTMKSASANKPTSGNYYGLLVLKSDTGNYVEQIAFKESSYEVYIRTLSGTSWSNWEKVFINSKDISSSTSITATGMYALDAVQNNASVEGTLANKLAKTYCGKSSATSSNGIFTLTVPDGYAAAIAQIQGLWGAATVVNVSLSGTTLSIATNVTGEYTFTFAYMLFK